MKILYAGNKKNWHLLIEKVLTARSVEVVHAYSLKETLNKISQDNPDVVILDMTLQNGTAFDALPRIVKLGAPVLVIGYEKEGFNGEKLKALGATDVLRKPFTVEELLSVLRSFKKMLPELKKKKELEIVLPDEAAKESETVPKGKKEVTPPKTEELEITPLSTQEPIELEPEEVEIQPKKESIPEVQPLPVPVPEIQPKHLEIPRITPEPAEKKAVPPTAEEQPSKVEASLPTNEKLKEILKPEAERIIREVAWEVVPEIAEKVIREEIEKLIKSRLA